MRPKRRVAVVKMEPSSRVVRRFRTAREASRWIGRLKNQRLVLAGGYGIDCPEHFKP